MIRFMVIAAPRSGTAWTANWLTDNERICLHDPLWDMHYEDLDAISYPGKLVGLSCTGIALFPDWVNQHPARKVILHRAPHEVQASLASSGLPPAPAALFDNLDKIDGHHYHWRAIFHRPRDIFGALFEGEDPDGSRHEQLLKLNVAANVGARRQNRDVMARFRRELHGELLT